MQWENLLHLDTIKARSKPIQPPKKPEAAPFFLPTVPGLASKPVFAAAGSVDGIAAGEGTEAEDGLDEAGELSLCLAAICVGPLLQQPAGQSGCSGG